MMMHCLHALSPTGHAADSVQIVAEEALFLTTVVVLMKRFHF